MYYIVLELPNRILIYEVISGDFIEGFVHTRVHILYGVRAGKEMMLPISAILIVSPVPFSLLFCC